MKSDQPEKEIKVKAGMKSRTIHVDYLARVEGEGAMYIKTDKGKVSDVQLRIFEPPRFFEGFLRGRKLTEVPDITARICGICPVAYQTSSVNAMENALGISIPDHIHQLRRLLYCGEWIESHTLHVLMLHAPDFLGYMDVVQLAKDHPDVVKKGLHLKKVGNDLMSFLAGREIHPINVCVGGFYKLPRKKELCTLIDPLKQARDDALAVIRWVSGFNFPQLERKFECVCLSHPQEYPMGAGRIVSSSGLNIDVTEYDRHFEEEHAAHSTALRSVMKGKGAYLTGPIARYNLCRKQLPPLVHEAIREIHFEEVCTNPFRSIIVRSLEVLFACDEALRIIDSYDWEELPPSVPLEFRAAMGCGASEAPRGLLFHRYHVDQKGIIQEAKIVAPTSQNQKSVEEDLFDFVSQNMQLPDDELTWKCEQAIRNYDPCISCSAHFIKLVRSNG